MGWWGRGVVLLCIGAALLTLAMAALLLFDGDRGTLGTLLLFAPRRFVPAGWLLLALVAVFASWRWGVVALCGALLSALFVADFNIPSGTSRSLKEPRATARDIPLRLVSYNVDYDTGLRSRLAEAVPRWNADVILFQACGNEAYRDLQQALRGRVFLAAVDEFCVASTHPILSANRLGFPERNGRSIAAHIRLRVGADTVSVVSVHLASPRRELSAALRLDFSLLSRTVNTRALQSARLLESLLQIPHPLVVAGDFNTLASSRIYRAYFKPHFRNAFSACRWGLGYTMAAGLHRLRIDHLLLRPGSAVSALRVERDWPTEHHPMVASVRLRHSERGTVSARTACLTEPR